MLLRAARASIPIAVAIALSGCGGGAGGPAPPIDKATYVPPQQELMAPGPLGDRVLGKATAPVTVIEYVSLTCPHCANFQKTLFPRVKKEFIDTGKVRYIVREFPIGHMSGAAAIWRDRHADLLHQWPQGARRGHLRRDQVHDRAGTAAIVMTCDGTLCDASVPRVEASTNEANQA